MVNGKNVKFRTILKNLFASFAILFVLSMNADASVIIVNPGESIQAAIESLPPEGGTVELAAGVFDITSEAPILINKNNVFLRGQGMDDTELVYYGFPSVPSSEANAIIYAVDVKNIGIEKMYIHSTDPGGASIGACFGIHLRRISDVIISEVKASNFRGGLQTNLGDNEIGWTVDNMTISDCIFTNNYCGCGNVFTVNSKFLQNEFSYSYDHCGLEFNSGCDNNLIEDNVAHTNQYAFKFYVGCDNNTYRNNTAYNNQIGIYGQNIRMDNRIINNLIYDGKGWGIAIEGPSGYPIEVNSNTIVNCGVGLYNFNYDVTAKNNIFVNNPLSGTIQSSYNNFWNSGTPTGIGDISVDPLFADPTNGDFHLKSTAGRWDGSTWVTDSVSSPCIDAGDPSLDYGNEPESNGGRINMGAYGNTDEASKSGLDTTPPTITAHSPTGTNIPVGTTITITFSEPMNQTSVEDAFSFSPYVSGSFSWNDNIMSFAPYSNLSYVTIHTVNVSTVAEDLAGNNLELPYSWQFTTGYECYTYRLVNPGESIQDAINTLCFRGGTIELGAGTHNIDATIVMGSGVTLIGKGIDTTKIYGEGTFHMIKIADDTNVKIQNLSIDTAGMTLNNDGISIDNSSNILISHVNVSNCWSGIQTNRNLLSGEYIVDNLTVEDSILTYNYGGMGNVFLINSKIIRVEASYNDGWCGIEFNAGCDYNLVEDCVSHHNTGGGPVDHGHGNGFEVYSGCNDNIFRNNIAYANEGHGFSVHRADRNNKILNNIIYNNGGDGIRISVRAGDPYSVSEIIESNTIFSNNWSGIHLVCNYDVYAKNNIVFGNNNYDIQREDIGEGIGTMYLSYNDAINYSGVSPGINDISVDPLFADPTNRDFHLKSTAGRWDGSTWVTDSVSSPCIDAGDPSSDYGNEPESNGGRINMGAYGNTDEASKTLTAFGAITGTVIDTFNNPIQGATVTDGSRSDTTNSTGGYTFSNVPAGTYTVKASTIGYYSQTIGDVKVLEDQTTTVNFQLIEDKTSPTILNVNATGITGSSAIITWTTDEPATSKVEYGLTTSYSSSTTLDTNLVISHSQTITGLIPETDYHYQVKTEDEAGNEAVSGDYTFTTAQVADLIAEWHFDEGSETTTYDTSGNGNDGLIHSASWTEGKLGSALRFDGNDDYVSISNSFSLNPTDEITVEAWVKTGNISQVGYNKIIAKPYTSYTSPWQQYALTLYDNQFVFELNTEGVKDIVTTTEILTPDTWYHVAGTYDGSEMKIYVNGELNGTQSKSGAIAVYPTDVHIGAGIYSDAQTEYINGTIDEVRILDRALSADEVRADYEAGLEDTTPPIINAHSPTGTNVPVGTVISTTFSEPMNTSSAEDAFSVSPSLAGTFSWIGDTMTFTPGLSLSYETTYTVTIDTAAVDLAGNHLGSPYIWQFTTEIAPDAAPTSVTDPTAAPSIIPDDTDNDPQWGESSRLNVTVTDDDGIASVTIDLFAIGGSSAQPMNNIGNNIWSVNTSAAAGTPPQTYDLGVNATDIYGHSNTSVVINLTVVKNGDVNNDGKVDYIGDAVYLVRHTRNTPGYEEVLDRIADVTGDGEVDFINDAAYLIRHIRKTPGYEILH